MPNLLWICVENRFKKKFIYKVMSLLFPVLWHLNFFTYACLNLAVYTYHDDVDDYFNVCTVHVYINIIYIYVVEKEKRNILLQSQYFDFDCYFFIRVYCNRPTYAMYSVYSFFSRHLVSAPIYKNLILNIN